MNLTVTALVLMVATAATPVTKPPPKMTLEKLMGGEDCLMVIDRHVYRNLERLGFKIIHKCNKRVIIETTPPPTIHM